MSWMDNLQDASFRGVPFKVDQDEATLGRRVQVHEYPNRDKPWAEDLGRATRRFSVQAYLIGDDFFTQRNRLIEQIEKPGAGTLVHPYYGEMTVTVTDEVRVSHTRDEGRMCRVSFTFVEAGELSFPTAGLATSVKLATSGTLLGEALGSVFAGFSLDGLPDFTQNGVLSRAAEMMDSVTKAFQYVDSGITAASRILQTHVALLLRGELGVLLSLPLPPGAVQFVTSLQNMWRAGEKLAGDTAELVSVIKGLAHVSVSVDLAASGVWKTDSATSQAQTRLQNSIAQTIRISAIAAAAAAVTLLPKTLRTTASSRSLNSTPQAQHPAVSELLPDAAAGATRSTDAGELPAWEELAEIRDTLNAAIDLELTRVSDDSLFLALRQLRTDLNSDISARLEQLSRTIERTPPEVLPALVLAADWFDSAARESDITVRNGIHHPGFVPVQILRVPAQ